MLKTESYYQNRRKKIIRDIHGEAALFPAAPVVVSSRDSSYPYRPDSDFYYLTGINEPHAALLLLGTGQGPRSILYLRERDAAREVWEGERIGLQRAKRRYGFDEVRNQEQLALDMASLLTDVDTLHFPAGVNPEMDELIWELFRSKVGPQRRFPNVLSDARLLTSEMRIVKDKKEIQIMEHAAEVTAEAFCRVAPQLKTASSETHAAHLLEAEFSRRGILEPAFPTIVASGKHATYLHHHPTANPLWKRELVLIDAGASYRRYAADITRVFPVSGRFSTAQADIYDVVYRALRQGRRYSQPNTTLAKIHRIVVKALTHGLHDLGILRGRAEQSIQNEKYKQFYMHSTSHWLGLDVHDMSPISYGRGELKADTSLRPLVPGNTFTLEPGLYFPPNDTSVPKAYRGIGVRIEDDILITSTGCRVLSQKMPSKRRDIEDLMS